MEHLGDAVVCEHCDFVDVFEVAVSFAFEAGPEVGDKDLGPLVEMHRLAFEPYFISETWKVVD